MPKISAPAELLTGTCQQLLFSPKGGIEGLLLKTKGTVVQVTLAPEVGAALAGKAGPGKRLRVLALLDGSPKAAQGMHPVYQFEALANAAGEALPGPADGSGLTTMKGKVAQLHYARHGQPNGVVLETGEFIHLRPHGMQALGLNVGARVSAQGALRITVLGTRMLEAHHANGHAIE